MSCPLDECLRLRGLQSVALKSGPLGNLLPSTGMRDSNPRFQMFGDPGGTRTRDPRLKRALLLPPELRSHFRLPSTFIHEFPFCCEVVGVVGFEPTTSWSRTMRDTRLRYTPNNCRTDSRDGLRGPLRDRRWA